MNLSFVFLQAAGDYDGSYFRYYVFLHDSSAE